MAEDYRPTILVVDDDAKAMRLMSTALADAEFQVLEARGGLEAMSTMLRHDGEIALAVVEINMPRINGLDLANHMGIERPTTEVLYVSDLVESVAVKSITVRQPGAVLIKPFTEGQLLARVRDFISRRAASADSVFARQEARQSATHSWPPYVPRREPAALPGREGASFHSSWFR
jgi:DNA-binding response OmpR family regulator